MTSADFCRFSMTLRPWLSLSGRFLQTSPGTTRFFPSTYLPHLPSLVPCSYGTSTWVAALSSVIAYMRFLFVRPEVCQPASFRFRLAADTLAFGYTFPTTGQIPDFHRLETCAAGRTIKWGCRTSKNVRSLFCCKKKILPDFKKSGSACKIEVCKDHNSHTQIIQC